MGSQRDKFALAGSYPKESMDHIDRIDIRDADGGAVIAVKVVPGSSRDRIAAVLGDALKITTTAAAQRGKANAAITQILAEALGISPRDIQLISGRTSARKEFYLAGLSVQQLRRRLAEI